jgi:hypothetical protein
MNRIRKMIGPGLVLFFCSLIQISSAQTIKDVFTSSKTPILYLGLDFTLTRLIGESTVNGIDMRDKYFPELNELVIKEPQKFDLQKAFNKTTIKNDLSIVEKRNKKINADDIISAKESDYSRLHEDDISKLVSGIDFEQKKGLGLLFIVEGMIKGEKKGDDSFSSVWVTIADMGANKVLMTERVEGFTSGGFTFRNYWAYTIYMVIDNIDKYKYKRWKKKYGH